MRNQTEALAALEARLFRRIAHGDDTHRAWLKAELEAFFNSEADTLKVLLERPQGEAVWCTPTEHEGRIVYEHTDAPMPGADSFRLYLHPQPQAKVPEGWKLVPVEPTRDMVWALCNEFEKCEMCHASIEHPKYGKCRQACTVASEDAYRKVLAAAPEPPAVTPADPLRDDEVLVIPEFLRAPRVGPKLEAIAIGTDTSAPACGSTVLSGWAPSRVDVIGQNGNDGEHYGEAEGC